MKGQWRIGQRVLHFELLFRLALSILFAALLWAMWPLWSHSPRWQIPAEDLLGFDESNGWLYTIPKIGDHFELRGYDLKTGDRAVTLSFCTESKEWRQRLTELRWSLSPDKSRLVVTPWFPEDIKVFDTRTGQPLPPLVFPKDPKASDNEFRGSAIGFSSDSQLIAARSAFGKLAVWNIASGKLRHYFQMSEPIQYSKSDFSSAITSDRIHISSDHRYLAAGGLVGHSYVCDLKKNEVIWEYRDLAIPRFLTDQRTVIVAPSHLDCNPLWYQVPEESNGVVRLEPKVEYHGSSHHFAAFTDDFLVTCYEEPRGLWVDWFPEQFVNGRLLTFEFRNLKTGINERTFAVPIPGGRQSYVIPNGIRHFGHVQISNDGEVIAFDDRAFAQTMPPGEKYISLWEMHPSRSWYCWLWCLLVALGVIFWTRPKKRATTQ
jgi:hypothetical protein